MEGGKYRDPLEEIGEGNKVAGPDLLRELQINGGKAAAGVEMGMAAMSGSVRVGENGETVQSLSPTRDLSPYCPRDRYYHRPVLPLQPVGPLER